jgi:hypothetical protein
MNENEYKNLFPISGIDLTSQLPKIQNKTTNLNIRINRNQTATIPNSFSTTGNVDLYYIIFFESTVTIDCKQGIVKKV